MNLGSTFYIDFIISDPATGSPIDADELPLIKVFENDTDIPMYEPLSVKRVSYDGHYRVQMVVTAANGFEEGKTYSVAATAIVAGTTAKSIIKDFIPENMRAQIASTINIPAPYSFEPTVDDLAFEKPSSIQEEFGDSSDYEFKEFVNGYWDYATSKWKTDSELQVPAEVMAEVTTAQQNIELYNAALNEWQANYDLQKEVQWRIQYADALIAAAG